MQPKAKLKNYYSIDCLKDRNGRLFVAEIQGSWSAGMKFFRNAYGNPAEAKVYEDYFKVLSGFANGKTIYYNWFAPTNILAVPSAVTPLLNSTHSAQPGIFEAYQKKAAESAQSSIEEHNRIERFASRKGINAKFGKSLFRLGKPTSEFFYCAIVDLVEEQIKEYALKEGVYVQRGQTSYPSLNMPMINNPAADFSVLNKLWPTLILREFGKDYYFPEHIFVGMGLSSEEELRDFLASESRVVVKPTTGSFGFGLEFKLASDLAFPKEVHTSPCGLDEKNPITWAQALDTRAYVPIDFGVDSKIDLRNYLHIMERSLKKSTVSNLQEEVACIGFPVHESGSALIQRYVDAELIKGKDGQFHKGYIRAFFMGDRFLGAWYRLPVTAQTEDEFLDIRAQRTFFNPVSDETLDQVEKFGRDFIEDYESALENLGLKTTQDVVAFRNKKIQKMIQGEASAIFG